MTYKSVKYFPQTLTAFGAQYTYGVVTCFRGRPADCNELDERVLRRLLRGLDVHTSGHETQAELQRRLRLHL